MDNIKILVTENQGYITELRRHFRMHPEIGGEEYETQQKIAAELKSLGLEPQMVAGTGVVAEIKGKFPGKTIALRCDIDALPIDDQVEHIYRSRNHGRCHACGHDAHMAMALGAAKVLSSIEITGNVRLLFQPSEERFPGGAEAMVDAGVMNGVSAVIGAHVWQPFPRGTIGISFGRTTASPDEFTLTIQGKGGHGSMPQQAIDPIFVGAQIVVALKAIVGTSINPLEQAVVSLGMFRAGEVFNIIPDTAVIKGTVRTFEPNVRTTVFDKIEQIASGICQAYGASFELEKLLGYPPVVNDPVVARIAYEAAGEVLGDKGVFEMDPVMVGEDFSYFAQQAPGVFIFIGIGNSSKGLVYPHHHPKFDMDEEALAPGTEVLVRTISKLLTKGE